MAVPPGAGKRVARVKNLERRVIDAVRWVKSALARGMSGALFAPASHFVKSPSQRFMDRAAQRMLEKFISNE